MEHYQERDVDPNAWPAVSGEESGGVLRVERYGNFVPDWWKCGGSGALSVWLQKTAPTATRSSFVDLGILISRLVVGTAEAAPRRSVFRRHQPKPLQASLDGSMRAAVTGGNLGDGLLVRKGG